MEQELGNEVVIMDCLFCCPQRGQTRHRLTSGQISWVVLGRVQLARMGDYRESPSSCAGVEVVDMITMYFLRDLWYGVKV